MVDNIVHVVQYIAHVVQHNIVYMVQYIAGQLTTCNRLCVFTKIL